MRLSSLKSIVVLFISLLLSSAVHAEDWNLQAGSPAEYFKSNPEKVEEFLEQVRADDKLTDKQKQAYEALVGANDSVAGDDVLELIDSAELAWFYGWEDQVEPTSGEATLHEAARITSEPGAAHFNDCLARAMCIMVSKSSQRLYAFIDGQQVYVNDAGRNQVNAQAWAQVSTARSGKWTPNGFFTVQELAHAGRVSSRYDGAALYYAMQIHGHIFIHGTSTGNYKNLGSPASAGCIRTRFSVAEQLNLKMREIGGRTSGVLADPSSVRVIVANSVPDNYLVAY